jgi:hypothetical protein
MTHALRRAASEKRRLRRGLCGKGKQRSMSFLQGHEVACFVVGFAVEPPPMKDADPLEGESTKRCLMGAATFTVALVESPGPEGARDGLAHPFDEGLALKGGARNAPLSLMPINQLARSPISQRARQQHRGESRRARSLGAWGRARRSLRRSARRRRSRRGAEGGWSRRAATGVQ